MRGRFREDPDLNVLGVRVDPTNMVSAVQTVIAWARYRDADLVNIVGGFKITILDLISMIVRLTVYQGEVNWDVTTPTRRPRRMLDVGRARERFGFEANLGPLLGIA